MKIRWAIYLTFVFLVTVGSLVSSCLREVRTQSNGSSPATIKGLFSRLWPAERQTKASWLATRDLVPNTQVSSADIRKPDFPTPVSALGFPESKEIEGKYVTAPIAKNQEIDAQSLTESPQIPAEAGKTLLFYSIQDLGTAAAQINAGAQVYVCETGKPCQGGPYPVEAVLGKPKPSAIVVRVSNSEADRLSILSKSQIRLAALP
jgi:hypothetical protein